MSNKIKLLDCTLRDGGYYNNWDFDLDLVRIYMKAMENASVDIMEIGFRSLPKRSFMGPFVYSLDDFLETLPLPKNVLIGVMINSSEYLEQADKPEVLINKLFKPAKISPVSLVRIAVNFEKANDVKPLVSEFKSLGYQVGVNLMQSQGKEERNYEQIAEKIKSWGMVDILYFADSFGSMDPSEVSLICRSLKKAWSGPLGIHTHNNKSLALINSIKAIESGVTWCDSTILGMGRGAGNVNTEGLLMECNVLNLHKGDASTLTECTSRFETLKRYYEWGPNPSYHFAANNKIHPTFVQFLLNDSRYKTEQIGSILKALSLKKSTSFSKHSIREAVYDLQENVKQGNWDATGWLRGRQLLLVGAGPSVERYSAAITNYIKNKKPAVIFLNINEHIHFELGDATVVAHPGRLLSESRRYKSLSHPVIMPASRMQAELKKDLKKLNILDYDLTLKDDSFHIGPKGCVLEWPLAFAYALCVATQSEASEIQLVGFDGYDPDDERQVEMNEVLAKYYSLQNCLPIKSLTPTNYSIQQGSIFEPVVDLKDFIVVIPARFRSSRFPGKPLAELCGKSLIRHVWDKCVEAVGSENVIVATDDERIRKHCISQSMGVIMTSSDCLTGTDRVFEVAQKLKREIYINVQGDEPLINPKDIIKVLQMARRYQGTIINGMSPIEKEKDFRDSNVPKVVHSPDGKLLYMSRSPIPTGKKHEFIYAKRQVCIYACPRNAILEFGLFNRKTMIEEIEDIEILRFLEMGYSIHMVDVIGSEVAIDTPEDLERAKNILVS